MSQDTRNEQELLAHSAITIDDFLVWLDALKRYHGGDLTLALEDGTKIEDAKVVHGVIVLYTRRIRKDLL